MERQSSTGRAGRYLPSSLVDAVAFDDAYGDLGTSVEAIEHKRDERSGVSAGSLVMVTARSFASPRVSSECSTASASDIALSPGKHHVRVEDDGHGGWRPQASGTREKKESKK